MKNYVCVFSVILLGLAHTVGATPPPPKSAPAAVAGTPATPTTNNSKPAVVPSIPAKTSPLRAVTSAGHGQAGYVHYFLITHPDGDLEYQVGVELKDQRIAWSFPDAGVIVSAFIKTGTLTVSGKAFGIEHLYGIQPFARDADMRSLQKELPHRVAYWIDNETPYCVMRQPGEAYCLNCGDFVARVLYPGAHPLIPDLPRDFLRVAGPAYTSDDLLLYFIGLHGLPNKRAMRAKLAALDMPAVMRNDIVAMLDDAETVVPTHLAGKPAPAANSMAVQPAPTKPAASRIAARRAQAKKI